MRRAPLMAILSIMTTAALAADAVPAGVPATATTAIPRATAAERDALIAQAIAAGLPDVRGATWWQGTWNEDPTQPWGSEGRPGFLRAHLRLTDGRWLLRGVFLRPAAEPAQLFAPGFVQFIPGHLPESGPGHAGGPFDLGSIAPTLALHALAGQAGFTIPGGNILISPALDFPIVPTPLQLPGSLMTPLTGTGAVVLRPTDDATALRRSLVVLAVLQAMHADTTEAVRACAAAALALTLPEERAVAGPALERLAELPPQHPAQGQQPAPTLDQQVTGWDGQLWYAQVHKGGATGESGFGGVPPWTAADADGLVALAGDTRPSRWIGSAGPATVGDNALRALGWLWGIDPRALAGRDPATPWNDAERAATATALRTFWRPGRSLLDNLLDHPATLPVLMRSRAAVATEPAERQRMATAIVAVWAQLDDAGREALSPTAVEDILGILGDAPELDRLALSWPVRGHLARPLALWHEVRGDHGPLTAHLREQLADRPAGPAAEGTFIGPDGVAVRYALPPYSEVDLVTVLRATALAPDQERLDLLLAAYRSAVGSPAWAFAHQVAQRARRGYRWGEETPLLDHRFDGFYGQEQLALALAYQGLWDERPLPADGPRMRFGETATEAADLRVCDEVAAARAGDFLRTALGFDDHTVPSFDLGKPKLQRDALLATARNALRPKVRSALAAGGLRMALPGSGPDSAPFPAWWQAELDAAKAEGKAVGLLITNTKTCHWCVVLEKKVLSQPAWQQWADAHLRMVVLDGAKQPDGSAFYERVGGVGELYGMAGYPSFILVGNDGHGLGRLAYEEGGPEFYIKAFGQALEREAKTGR